MKKLISIYVSLFLVFSPAFAQSKFNVGTPTEDDKVWTVTLSNGEILSNVQFRELRGDYLDIIEMGIPRTIYIGSITKISSSLTKVKSNAGKGAKIGLFIGAIIGVPISIAGFTFWSEYGGKGNEIGFVIAGVAFAGILTGLGAAIGSTSRNVPKHNVYYISNSSIEEKRAQIQKIMKK